MKFPKFRFLLLVGFLAATFVACKKDPITEGPTPSTWQDPNLNITPGGNLGNLPGAYDQWRIWSNTAFADVKPGLHDPEGAEDRGANTGCGSGLRMETQKNPTDLNLSAGFLMLHAGDTASAPFAVPANFGLWSDTTTTWQQAIAVAPNPSSPAGFLGTLFCPRAVQNGPIADPLYAQSFWVKVLDSSNGTVLETILFWVELGERAKWGLPATCVGASVFVKPKAGVTTTFLANPAGWEAAAPIGNLGSAATVGPIAHFLAVAKPYGTLTTIPGGGPGGSLMDTVLAINGDKLRLNGRQIEHIRAYAGADSLRVTVQPFVVGGPSEVITLHGTSQPGSVAYDFQRSVDEPNPWFGRGDAGQQPERRNYAFALGQVYGPALNGSPSALALEEVR